MKKPPKPRVFTSLAILASEKNDGMVWFFIELDDGKIGTGKPYHI